MCKIVTQYRDGFFRLGVSGSSKPNPQQYPDVTPQEIEEANDFWKDVFKLCKEVVQESVREQGYEFVPTGKGKERVLRRISSD